MLYLHIWLWLQVAFVVTVGLQGVFIFIFHCLRNEDVRSGWSGILKLGFSSSSHVSTEMHIS